MKNDANFVFFGTIPLAYAVLEALREAGFTPSLVIASPDRLDRKKKPVSPSEKEWALAHGVAVVQPQQLDKDFLNRLREVKHDFYIVASYGKILPQELLAIPRRGVINLHPSLLPRLRGPSPIRSAILQNEKEIGVSIMLLDEKMDHGPLLAQKKVPTPEWPMRGKALDELLAHEGGKLLASSLPPYLRGEIAPQPQNDDLATYCKMFTKEDGLFDLTANSEENLRKIRAFEDWPGTYAFFERNDKRIRTNILDAHIEDKKLVIDRVRPEGGSEMPYADFLRSGARPL